MRHSSSFSQNDPTQAPAPPLSLRKSNWWVKSKTFGKLTVGLEGTSTYHLLDDADGANTRNYADAEAAAVYQGAFLIRTTAFSRALTWANVERGFNNSTPGQDGRRNIVRYDLPEFGGFVASASWGEDELWDTSLTYKGEIHDFKLIGKIGYGESTDPDAATACGGPVGDFKCTWWGAAGTAMHQPTGLYLYAGYGEQTIEFASPGPDDTSTTWFLQPGIERKWHPIGKTTIFGEYRKDDAGANVSAAGVPATRGSDSTFYAGWRRAEHRSRPPWTFTSSTAMPKVTSTRATGRRATSSIDEFDSSSPAHASSSDRHAHARPLRKSRPPDGAALLLERNRFTLSATDCR